MAKMKKRGFYRKKTPLKRRHQLRGSTGLIGMYRNPDMFLSHNSKDKRIARKLAQDLNRVGVDAWLDEWELEAGDSLYQCIGTALTKSRYVAVILSPYFVNSPWCMEELSNAFARGKDENRKVIIPLLCKRAKVPPLLKDRLHLDISKNYLESLAKISVIIHRLSQKRIQEYLSQTKPKTVFDVADMLEDCGWDGERVFGEGDFEEFRYEMENHGYEVKGNTFEFPHDFDKIAKKLMHLRVIRDIYGED